jgi:hypothetical protein
MLGHQSANAANHSSLEWQEDSSRLTTIVRDLVGYTLEEVERELILNSLDQYGGCRTYTANVLGMSIRCLRNKISQYAAMGIPVTAPGQRDDVTTVRHPPDCLSCGRPMRFERTITQVHTGRQNYRDSNVDRAAWYLRPRTAHSFPILNTFIRNYTDAERHGDACRVPRPRPCRTSASTRRQGGGRKIVTLCVRFIGYSM